MVMPLRVVTVGNKNSGMFNHNDAFSTGVGHFQVAHAHAHAHAHARAKRERERERERERAIARERERERKRERYLMRAYDA